MYPIVLPTQYYRQYYLPLHCLAPENAGVIPANMRLFRSVVVRLRHIASPHPHTHRHTLLFSQKVLKMPQRCSSHCFLLRLTQSSGWWCHLLVSTLPSRCSWKRSACRWQRPPGGDSGRRSRVVEIWQNKDQTLTSILKKQKQTKKTYMDLIQVQENNRRHLHKRITEILKGSWLKNALDTHFIRL